MRDMVFRGLRVRVEMIWMREPEVTAKQSGAEEEALELREGGGHVMLVIGEECCDGSRKMGDVNVSQYFCSGVRDEGPFG